MQRAAIKDVSLTILKGEYRAIIGSQGSGKSTLLQVMAGLLEGQGQVEVCGFDLGQKKNRNQLWNKVGLIFQYPERQLFEENVWEDVAYGPKNLGLSPDEVERRVKEALEKVNLGKEYYEMSPFRLSGGQQRRAAIAGVLAMEPEVLLLDEPTAGLDPQSKRQLMKVFSNLCKEKRVTMVLVTHDMEEVVRWADTVTILNEGNIALEGTPAQIFQDATALQQLGLSQPFAAELTQRLVEKGLPIKVSTTMSEVEREVEKILRRRK